jgi:hypothetical protein
MLQTPPRGGVGRISGVVAFLSLLTLSIVYRVWFKGTLIKVSEETLSPSTFLFPWKPFFASHP